MSSVCWLEDRDDRLARARALAASDPCAALAMVDAVLAEVADDVEALRARGAVLVDVADAEPDARRALALHEEAIALLRRGGAVADADLAAAERGRAAALRERDSAAQHVARADQPPRRRRVSASCRAMADGSRSPKWS